MASTPRVISSPSCRNSLRNWLIRAVVRSCSTWRKASCARSSISQATAPTLAVMPTVITSCNLVFNDTLARSFHPELVKLPRAVGLLLPVVRVAAQPQHLGNMRDGQDAKAVKHFALDFKQ